MDKGYKVIDNQLFEGNPKLRFIRIEPLDIKLTLQYVFKSLADLSWIERFDEPYIRHSFEKKSKHTIEYIAEKIIKSEDDAITKDSGEYVVSELARQSVVQELDYLNIPLAELWKKQKAGNPGFDFYSENKVSILLFGEAKYTSEYGSYQAAFKQINRFIKEGADIEDLTEVDAFCSRAACDNVIAGNKGYIAAFSSKTISTEALMNHIKNNVDFKDVCQYEEIICVAVNL